MVEQCGDIVTAPVVPESPGQRPRAWVPRTTPSRFTPAAVWKRAHGACSAAHLIPVRGRPLMRSDIGPCCQRICQRNIDLSAPVGSEQATGLPCHERRCDISERDAVLHAIAAADGYELAVPRRHTRQRRSPLVGRRSRPRMSTRTERTLLHVSPCQAWFKRNRGYGAAPRRISSDLAPDQTSPSRQLQHEARLRHRLITRRSSGMGSGRGLTPAGPSSGYSCLLRA
jgi:hypothetical protein